MISRLLQSIRYEGRLVILVRRGHWGSVRISRSAEIRLEGVVDYIPQANQIDNQIINTGVERVDNPIFAEPPLVKPSEVP